MMPKKASTYWSTEGHFANERATSDIVHQDRFWGNARDSSYLHGLFWRTNEIEAGSGSFPDSASNAAKSNMGRKQGYILRHIMGGMEGVPLNASETTPDKEGKKVSSAGGGIGGVHSLMAGTLLMSMPSLAMPQEASMVQTGVAVKQMTDLKSDLQEKEGIILKPRVVEKGKKNKTVGYGHLLDSSARSKAAWQEAFPNKTYGSTLTKAEAQTLFDVDILDYIETTRELTADFDTYSWELKKSLIQATYRGSWSGSPKARKLLREGKFDEAADEFLNRKDYRLADPNHPKYNGLRGIRARMEAVAEAIRAEGERRAQREYDEWESQNSPDFDRPPNTMEGIGDPVDPGGVA
jgi:GH24 family phage-related lysozyme (muramidase)